MKFLFLVALIAVGSVSSLAQDIDDAIAAAREQRSELIKQSRLERTSLSRIGATVDSKNMAALAAGPTDEEVGDSSSFNKNARFFGTATTGFVLLEPDCDPAVLGFELGPDDRCAVIADPNVLTDVTFNDIGRITFPGKLADNIIYGIFNHSTSALMRNGTSQNAVGFVNYIPTYTIESEALNDPAAIDPSTGLPMNGSFTVSSGGSKFNQMTLAPLFVSSENHSYTRANTLGISRSYWAAIGLPQNVINKFYKRPITIKLNMRIRTRLVQFASYASGARFLAN